MYTDSIREVIEQQSKAQRRQREMIERLVASARGPDSVGAMAQRLVAEITGPQRSSERLRQIWEDSGLGDTRRECERLSAMVGRADAVRPGTEKLGEHLRKTMEKMQSGGDAITTAVQQLATQRQFDPPPIFCDSRDDVIRKQREEIARLRKENGELREDSERRKRPIGFA